MGDCRDGEPSIKLEVKDAVVFMLEDDVPDLAGIADAKCEIEGRERSYKIGMAGELVSAFKDRAPSTSFDFT